MIIVSACLAGLNTRYDGSNQSDERIISLLKKGSAVPVCPEHLGGLSTPRPKAEIVGGDGKDVLSKRALIISEKGEDLTEHFMRGAYEVLKISKIMNIDEAILKDGSPSCGVSYIRRGGKKVSGMGVTAALLSMNGIKVISNDSL